MKLQKSERWSVMREFPPIDTGQGESLTGNCISFVNLRVLCGYWSKIVNHQGHEDARREKAPNRSQCIWLGAKQLSVGSIAG
jgi:hypothetical protein